MSIERIEPGPGQESVWDYPRPPRLEVHQGHIRVLCQGVLIADSRRAKRVLETSHPPNFYIPPSDVKQEYLLPASGQSFCEWKGLAGYYDLAVGDTVLPRVAWFYRDPSDPYALLRNNIAFYAHSLECYVDGERAIPQPGGFYGGWITSRVTGPFKGEPGTMHW